MEHGNLTFQWSLNFIHELVTNGLEHIVVSPGSRSTPLTLAAASVNRVEKHVVLDERSAGFMALGIGKATGKPAALICTSGTAAANYYPAVIEARMAGVPLLILTADRPPQLRAVGASQAIDQIKLYGDYPLMFFEVGEPQSDPEDLERLRLLACQAYSKSKTYRGPVHLNFAFRKPLEPNIEYLEKATKELHNSVSTKQSPKTLNYTETQLIDLPEEIKREISHAKRPLVIAGPSGHNHHYRSALAFSKEWSIPLIAESPSQLSSYSSSGNQILGFDAFLRSDEIRNELKPDLILRFGDQPISKGLELYLKHHKDTFHILFSNHPEWQDATFSIDYRIDASPDTVGFGELNLSIEENWLTKWQNYRDHFLNLREKVLKNEDVLTDGVIYHQIGEVITGSENIFLSNSFPVRDFDLFAVPVRGNHPFFINRGASGIDGVISTSIGATISSKRNGILFIGDLAFLHDSNALLSNKFLQNKQTLVIVVLNNRGGNIFRMLPVYEHKKYFDTYFETPQDTAIKKLAEAHHLGYRRVQYQSSLPASFKELSKQTGIQILECITDSEKSMEQRKALWEG